MPISREGVTKTGTTDTNLCMSKYYYLAILVEILCKRQSLSVNNFFKLGPYKENDRKNIAMRFIFKMTCSWAKICHSMKFLQSFSKIVNSHIVMCNGQMDRKTMFMNKRNMSCAL